MRAPIELRHGAYSARITRLGGGLDSLQHHGTDLILRQDDGGGPPGFRGAVLAPWSNRIADGHYEFGGRSHQLPITEPERNNALHGLVLDQIWQLAHHTADAVTLSLRPPPSDGYPYALELSLRYALSAAGLDVALDTTNIGDSTAPYGCGFHPYIRASGACVDDANLRFDAGERLRTDPARLLPIGREPITDTAVDFSRGARIGDRRFDDAYSGFRSDANGWHSVELDGVRVSCDASLPWVQLFTPQPRTALAIEPCTAPANAFRTGDDLIALEPGDRHSARWRIESIKRS